MTARANRAGFTLTELVLVLTGLGVALVVGMASYWAIRLLLPPGSALLRGDRARPWLGELAPGEFGYRWVHPDPRMDRLHEEVSRRVEEGAQKGEDAAETFAALRALGYRAAGREAPARAAREGRAFVPHLTEAWFCCAEPSRMQLEQVGVETDACGCSKSYKCAIVI